MLEFRPPIVFLKLNGVLTEKAERTTVAELAVAVSQLWLRQTLAPDLTRTNPVSPPQPTPPPVIAGVVRHRRLIQAFTGAVEEMEELEGHHTTLQAELGQEQ